MAAAHHAGTSDGPRAPGGLTVTVHDDGGAELARVPLGSSTFAVSYRNSVYESRAEERYVALRDGRFRLRHIAADERAVIEEYYALTGARRTPAGDRRRWVADAAPGRQGDFDDLTIAATELGRRTLHVPGRPPVRLWRLVGHDPVVVLDIERTP